MKVRLAIGVAAFWLLCGPALAQTPTPDPAPVPPPPPPPPTSEPSTPSAPAAAPSPSSAEIRIHPRKHREHAKKRPPAPALGPFHPSFAELGPSVLTPAVKALDAERVFTEMSAVSGSDDRGPRPLVIALALVLVLMAGVVLVVFFQY